MKNNIHRQILVFGLMVISLSASAKAGDISKRPDGVSMKMSDGALLVDFEKADIVRVRFNPENRFDGNNTAVCIDRQHPSLRLKHKNDGNGRYSISSDSLTVTINMQSGALSFFSNDGSVLLEENQVQPRSFDKVFNEDVTFDKANVRTVNTVDGQKLVTSELARDTIGYCWRYNINFKWKDGEALYGLGSHMEDYMNLRGKQLFLCQHNLKAMMPVLNSTNGYGLLFDAGCAMIYSDKDGQSGIQMEAASEIDYYFMKGTNLDAVVGNYRYLTGGVPMQPLYMFGYIQSKERYTSSSELIGVVSEYRKRQIPLDVIVQDWCYWPQGWGYMKMNPRNYPSVSSLTDSIHGMNAHMMVSIWPNMSNCPQADDFMAKGYIIKQSGVYDAFNPEARKYYWSCADKEFFNNGVDAWWCDCTEPVDADWNVKNDFDPNDQQLRWSKNTGKLSDILGNQRSCLFSLYHSMGIYENQRKKSPEKRVVNLTRSSYAGQQRFGTITWNGDTYASWSSFAQQIPSGLNFMATGSPYWTIDIGAFFTKKTDQWFYAGQYDKGVEDMAYRELYVRMFQFGAFLPIFRSHGTDTPREVWRFGKQGDPFYESIVSSINLRYRLLPYIYSLSARVSSGNYTMARLLAFDFSGDKKVYDIKDQYMFGPSFMVNPVTCPFYFTNGSEPIDVADKSRLIYLPEGRQWIDFWTGIAYDGNQTIKADAPIGRIPLFVPSGSIIPMGERMQYSSEKPDSEYEIRIYPGADASFEIYEDSGDGYGYENGESSAYKLLWDDDNRTLTITDRKNSFGKLVSQRRMNIVIVSAGVGIGEEVYREGKHILYKGRKIKVKM